jgi:hypothetical protein
LNKKIIYSVGAVAFVAFLGLSLIPGVLSSTCPPPMITVDASNAPEYDLNGNNVICESSRTGPDGTMTWYQDDF